MPQPSNPSQPVSGMPASRRFFRRVKSAVLRFEPLYRFYLRCKCGAGRLSLPPDGSLPNCVLQSRSEWQEVARRAKELHMPLHRAEEKNWDHLAAVHAIANTCPASACVLDAGAEFYSNILPALFLCGFSQLYGINLALPDPARRGPIRYLPGDMTRSGFPGSFFDAVTCMSVIEHGVPLHAYFREMFRVLKPGGILITSTDYYPDPIETRNQYAHGAPVKIFSRREAEEMLALAAECGFESTGPIDLDCSERPIRWELYNLDFTFLIFTLRKPMAALQAR